MESLIEEIQIHEEKTAEGQWLKAIRFRLPINPEGDSDGLDDAKPPETVCLLSKLNVNEHIYVDALKHFKMI